SLMMDMEKLSSGNVEADSSQENLPDSDYRLIRKIGSGGMGDVFEAIQISLNRPVAVKLLNSSLLINAEQRAQFENEAKVIAMLHHPNIVKIYSAGCSEERCYYAMELIDGDGLDHRRFDDLRELARIGLQAASALAYAHGCGILHRDVKPANLLLDKQGNVHISDFGIAFILNGNEPVMETGSHRSGTLRYMAPERLAHGVNTFASDQYSFGVTLYELVTGEPVLNMDSAEKLKKRIAEEPLPPLVCDEPDFAAIVNKCIRFNPNDRYSGMDEVAADLRRFLQREPVKAAVSSPLHHFILWCRRKPTVAALSFAVMICIMAFMVSLGIGYARTQMALKLAERNATVADSAISQIFTRVSEQPPSQKNTELLSTLLPYYQMIADQRNIPSSRLCEAYDVIAECAERTDRYPLAEKAFRDMMEYRHDAYPMNQLATILKKQGKNDESEKLSRQVITDFENSEDEKDRFEVVRALLAVSSDPNSHERTQAFRILESLLKEHPENAEYRFQYAMLLDGNPRLYQSLKIPGVESNASVLLLQLAEEYPDNPEYSLALLKLMLSHSRLNWMFRNKRDSLEKTLLISERMLGRWPNDPQIVAAVVELRSRYVEILRRAGGGVNMVKENERLLSILEFLFFNP
ncbi:MAG: protein kinase, partial [Victivallales bacterium]|nr:protein kinase [Victivallales bacterium]